MMHRTSLSISLLLALAVCAMQTYGQVIDRSVLSNSYQSQGLQGEWVLGETIVADFRGAAQELNSGFLSGELRFMSTRTETHSEYSFEVFPNPCSDQIHVQHNFPGAVIIEIRDLHGRSQVRQRLKDHYTTLLVSQLPLGPYFLHYHSSSQDVGVYLVLKTK